MKCYQCDAELADDAGAGELCRACQDDGLIVLKRPKRQHPRTVGAHLRVTPFALQIGAGNMLAAGQFAIASTRPQCYVRAQWLVLPPEVARALRVVDVRVGNISQFGVGGALPGFLFAGAFTDPWDAPRLAALAETGAAFSDEELDAADENERYQPGVRELRAVGLRVPLVQLMGDTCGPGWDITVQIENRANHVIEFAGAILGETLPWS